jgi:Holliday junction resolvase RusA-like endonuclease
VVRTFTFVVRGKPRGKGRPRFAKTGHAYTPRETVEYEREIATLCKQAMNGAPPIEGPIALHIAVIKPIPKATPKAVRAKMVFAEIRPINKPDLDNVLKAVMDGCNGVAYMDDKQIVNVNAAAYYGDEPCVIVSVTEINTEVPF